MTLREIARIELPRHPPEGGFDHAAVHAASGRLFVAHTSNDSVDVIDLRSRRYLSSLPALLGVAGVWVSEERERLFSSNRGEDTVSIFRLPGQEELHRLSTGARPNGLAFDPRRQLLLVAGVGNRETRSPPTATLFDAAAGNRLGQIELPGRTRWAAYHPASDSFYLNIADPPQIAQIRAGDPSLVHRFINVPASGPHGLEQDPDGRTLYCACDDGTLIAVDLDSGTAAPVGRLAGAPDVLWLNPSRGHLYAAIGDPGLVQVFRTRPFSPVESYPTAAGAHTLTVDPSTGEVHVFLPDSHEDLVLRDEVD